MNDNTNLDVDFNFFDLDFTFFFFLIRLKNIKYISLNNNTEIFYHTFYGHDSL